MADMLYKTSKRESKEMLYDSVNTYSYASNATNMDVNVKIKLFANISHRALCDSAFTTQYTQKKLSSIHKPQISSASPYNCIGIILIEREKRLYLMKASIGSTLQSVKYVNLHGPIQTQFLKFIAVSKLVMQITLIMGTTC